ncbi:hypothetical protein BT93_D1254 [Corymbia citriodora subsp. variegata]|nr:hypothetical protein BT93_D1254 [Corymbia citriodora subsp. variegata]
MSIGPSLLWQGNNKGDTPLHVAAKVGSCEVVRVFTDLAKSLHWVVENGQVDARKELLRKQNLNKDTVLHYAIRGGCIGVVKLLIEEDSQLCDIINAVDESPLYLATDRGLSCIIELLLGAISSSSSHKGPKGFTALHAGISLSHTSWAKIMEKRPEMIREGDDMGWTPLHYVAHMGKVVAVRLLLQHDTFVAYDLDKAGQLALHLAAFRGHANVIDELVRSCPDACDLINTKGQTALHVAVLDGRVNVVNYILRTPNQKNLINEQDSDGSTALHLAALHKNYKIISMLAQDERVDLLVKNKNHLTALDIFWAHNEVGYNAMKVRSLLKGSHGIRYRQDSLIEHGKMLDEQIVRGQPSASTTIGSNIADRDNFDVSKKHIIDVQLLVAGLLATVTFTAALQVPGGYINDGPNGGRATLSGSPEYCIFVWSNTWAFAFSLRAIVTQYRKFMGGRVIMSVGDCLHVAMFGMALAYVSALAATGNKSSGGTGDKIRDLFGVVTIAIAFFVFTYGERLIPWLNRRSSPIN